MLQRFLFLHAIIVSFICSAASSALAMPAINVSFAGNNSYMVSGTDLEDLAKVELSISYNAQLLTNPGLKSRSSFAGAAVAMDTDYSGKMKLTVVSTKPMQGRGTFATISFDPIGTSIGYVSNVTGRLYTSSGAQVPSAMYSVTNPTPPLDPSDPDDIPMIKEREAKGQTFMGGEVAYVPPEVREVEEQAKAPEEVAEAEAAAEEQAAPAAAEGGKGDEATADAVVSDESVVERFRLFKKERTPKNLIALFKPSPTVSRQEPAIAIADGKMTVRVTIGGVPSNKAPSFTFTAARYVAFQNLSETEWLLEAKPDKGATSAEIVILSGGKVRRIPLTVVPAARVDLTVPGKVTEADFELFLRERGTEKAPRHDLNGDGKRDYLDDYIFAANYLLARPDAAMEEKPAVVGKAEAKPASKN